MELAIIGILINLFGSFTTAFGLALQKKAHNAVAATGEHYITKRTWWFGLFLVIFSQPMYIISVTMVKVSVLGVVGPFGIIANILLASFFLKERIRLWEYIGMVLFIPGSIMTIACASLKNVRYNVDEFNELFYSPLAMIYLIITFSAMIVCMAIAHMVLKINPEATKRTYSEQIDDLHENMSPVESVELSEINKPAENTANSRYENKADPQKIGEIENITIKTIDSCDDKSMINYVFESPRLRVFPLVVYPYFGPFIASMNMTFFRAISGFASSEPEKGHDSNFDSMAPYVYMVLVVVGAVVAYAILNKALQHYDTIYVVPLFRIGDLLHNLASGAIFLGEFGEYENYEIA